jgi:magnesium transporter
MRVFDQRGVHTLDHVGQVSDVIGRDGSVLWVDLAHDDLGDLKVLADDLSLHDLAIEDTRKHGQRPKLEIYPSHAFIVCYTNGEDPHDLPELDLFVGSNWLVTVREPDTKGRTIVLDDVETRCTLTRGPEMTVAFLLYRLLDHVVDGYFDLVDHLDVLLETLEERIFEELDDGDGAPQSSSTARADGRHLQRDVLALRKEMLRFRRKVVPFREVLMALLRREVPAVSGDEVLLQLQDVLDHLLRVIDEVDAQRELVDNAVDAHLAAVSNRTNEIMKKTSSWGAILVVGALITGVYGMNFRHMPELSQRFGYPAALIAMVAVMGALYVYFRRKQWL